MAGRRVQRGARMFKKPVKHANTNALGGKDLKKVLRNARGLRACMRGAGHRVAARGGQAAPNSRPLLGLQCSAPLLGCSACVRVCMRIADEYEERLPAQICTRRRCAGMFCASLTSPRPSSTRSSLSSTSSRCVQHAAVPPSQRLNRAQSKGGAGRGAAAHDVKYGSRPALMPVL